jgi:hypothetical protein
VHNHLVVFAQRRPVPNGEHCDAGVHACLVQQLLAVC